ncbi:MAG TPA: DUF488 domain-containing protein [Candidatus Saccharimonadales bacterium]|nr:DUF488 domain-containing protein [Candidatus Saccharimonadales bacterium]
MLRTKSVYSPVEKDKDGLRLLVTRFRGRGLPASLYDVWMANLGPSEKLLKTFLRGGLSWPEFSARYRKEMFEPSALDARNATIKNRGQKFTLRLVRELSNRQTVTLLCHCAEDEPHCHRHILKKLLASKI